MDTSCLFKKKLHCYKGCPLLSPLHDIIRIPWAICTVPVDVRHCRLQYCRLHYKAHTPQEVNFEYTGRGPCKPLEHMSPSTEPY